MTKIFLLLALVPFIFAQSDFFNIAVTDGKNLNLVNSTSNTLSLIRIPSLASNEFLRSIAVLPGATAAPLLALSNTSVLYTLSLQGQLNAISTLSCDSIRKSDPTSSIAINPLDGSIAIVTIVPGGTTNYYTANITTGVCTPRTILTIAGNSATIRPTGIDYLFVGNNTAPTLFLADALTNALYTVPAAGGALTFVGNLVTNFTSGVGSLAVYYPADTTAQPFGFFALYNATSLSSEVFSVNLANANVNSLSTNLSALPGNILGLGILNNHFPAGTVSFAGGLTPVTAATTAAVTASVGGNTFTATIPLPFPSAGNTIVSTTAAFSSGGASSTIGATFVTAPASYTKSVQGYQGSSAGTNTGVATVNVNNGVTEVFTTTVNVASGTNTATVPATISVAGALSTTTVSVIASTISGTFSRVATALFGAVDRVTLPQISYTGPAIPSSISTISSTAGVIIGNNAGLTQTAVATIQVVNPLSIQTTRVSSSSSTTVVRPGSTTTTTTANANSASSTAIAFAAMILALAFTF